MDPDSFWDLNGNLSHLMTSTSPVNDSTSMKTLHDKLERLHSGMECSTEGWGNIAFLEQDHLFRILNDATACQEYKLEPGSEVNSGRSLSSREGRRDETGILVRVKHDPPPEIYLSQLQENDSGFGELPSLIDKPPVSHGYDLEDVFKGWGDTMYHLLWKIVNPVPLYDVEGPDYIDEVDLLKLRASLYDNSECHMNYLSLPMPLIPQFTPDPFEGPLLSPSQYFQADEMIFQPSSSSHFTPDFPSSSDLLLGNILVDDMVMKQETDESPISDPPPAVRTPCSQEILESSPKRVKLWETKCDICGLVLLGGQQRFEAHVKNAHELKCICGLDFKFKIKLTNHIKNQAIMGTDGQTQHGITPGDKIKPLFECDFCDEIFHNRSAAVKHRNVLHLNISDNVGNQGEKASRVVKKVSKRKEAPAETTKRVPKVMKVSKAKAPRNSNSLWNNRPPGHYNGKLGISKNMILKSSNTRDIQAPTIVPVQPSPQIMPAIPTVATDLEEKLSFMKPMVTNSCLLAPPPCIFKPNADSTNDISSFDESKCQEVVAIINLIGVHKSSSTGGGTKLKKSGTSINSVKKRLKMPAVFNEAKIKETKSLSLIKYEGFKDPANECEVSSTNNLFK